MAEQEESSSLSLLRQTQPHSDFSDFDLESFLAADLKSMHAESIAQDLVRSDAVQLRLGHYDEQRRPRFISHSGSTTSSAPFRYSPPPPPRLSCRYQRADRGERNRSLGSSNSQHQQFISEPQPLYSSHSYPQQTPQTHSIHQFAS